MEKFQDLHDIRTSLFVKSETLWLLSILLGIATQGIVLILPFINNNSIVTTTGFFLILFPIISSIMKELSSAYKNKGDKCRRLILYSDGLGNNISPHDLSNIRCTILGKAKLKEAPFVKPYYASNFPPGYKRLADITAESAFFTMHLARKMVFFVSFLIVLSVSILLAAVYFIYIAANSTNILTGTTNLAIVAKTVAVSMSFIFSCEIFFLWFKYNSLSNVASLVYKDCDMLRKEEAPNSIQVTQAIEEYHVSLIQSPPIPKGVYLKYKDQLNEAYRKSHYQEN